MKRGICKVIIIGNLGADPEIRRTASGECCANFSVAVSESWRDKNSGEQKEVTEWIRCVAWRKLAEIIEQYVKKGSKVYLEGRLQTRSWEQDGSKRYATEVIVGELQMLDSKPQSESAQPRQQSATQHRQPVQQPAPQQDSFEDDIPF